jgi:hypothetical protein
VGIKVGERLLTDGDREAMRMALRGQKQPIGREFGNDSNEAASGLAASRLGSSEADLQTGAGIDVIPPTIPDVRSVRSWAAQFGEVCYVPQLKIDTDKGHGYFPLVG